MLSQEHPTLASELSNSSQQHHPSPAGCILCQLLWPRILQHRHLPIEASLEQDTILITKECVLSNPIIARIEGFRGSVTFP